MKLYQEIAVILLVTCLAHSGIMAETRNEDILEQIMSKIQQLEKNNANLELKYSNLELELERLELQVEALKKVQFPLDFSDKIIFLMPEFHVGISG